VNPSEIAFLALGLVLGAAVGAALLEAVRARPMPRREVRITVSPNSIAPRRSATLASSDPAAGRTTIPGSPDDDGWLERRLAGDSLGGEPRTRVPSGPVSVPATAVAVALTPALAGTRQGGAVAVMDPVRPGAERAQPGLPSPAMVAGTPESTGPGDEIEIRPRPPGPASRPVLPSTAVAVLMHPSVPQPPPPARPMAEAAWIAAAAGSDPSRATADGPGPGPTDPSAPVPAAGPEPSGLRTCESERLLVGERCRLAEAAQGQARQAADALREGQRAYDILRERVERAQAIADPREIRAAKDALHRAFRDARDAAATSEAAEHAAREWLTEVNRLNTSAREAAHVVEAGGAELRALLPGLERLAVEADAARITAETAAAGCREAREALARCEEAALAAAAATAAAAVPPLDEEPSERDLAWPTSEEGHPLAGVADAGGAENGEIVVELSAIVRVLRGDRSARERLIASLAAGDPEAGNQWPLRIAGLVDAITARAIEDGYLGLPDDGFWGTFALQERREIVGALSALGFRFDGLGGFADGRVPAQRDLSLAVGYAGLDRMRIRNWPREEELAALFAEASVAADEWLARQAGDLSLGSMVDALGARAAELADLWNAWGRVRPALLATD
jgi:hypothetical protein